MEVLEEEQIVGDILAVEEEVTGTSKVYYKLRTL